MVQVTLGRTGIVTNKNAFGALPIQRVSAEYAGMLLRKAYEGGITFFDTARSYSDSEEKMGLALHDVRDKIFIATKTPSTTVEGFWKDLETSLRLLRTDYVDIYQFHNPDFCPKPGDGTGLYEAMLEGEGAGENPLYRHHQPPAGGGGGGGGLRPVRHFAVSLLLPGHGPGHRPGEPVQGEKRGVHLHEGAVRGASHQRRRGLRLAGPVRERPAHLGRTAGGGAGPVPLLPPVSPGSGGPELLAIIEKDRKELIGNFCRACGYCMPCRRASPSTSAHG